ncbi:unnamed protein product [Schistosoma margrebowiei]|uniref:Uncharacterized protein n=1 Tax=Schistosoma margrebowiei TaxID=48269 RepID=A0A3P8ES64_9TREM|nr:unnamed protein product [Schistosoma margrebowiei]
MQVPFILFISVSNFRRSVLFGLALFRFASRSRVSPCLVMQFDDLSNVCHIHFHRLFLISSSTGSWNATLALPILAFTSASEPPCSSMMLSRASAGILSGPAAFPSLICLMAILISSVVGGMTWIGRSVYAASTSGGFGGAGQFKIPTKCFTHLFLYFSDWLGFFFLDRSFWFTIFPCQFIRCVM